MGPLKGLWLHDENDCRQRRYDFALWSAIVRFRLENMASGGMAVRPLLGRARSSPGPIPAYTMPLLVACNGEAVHMREGILLLPANGGRIISHMRFDISNMRYLTSVD